MRSCLKQRVQRSLGALCAFAVMFSAIPAEAEDIAGLESKTSELQSQLDDINQELLEISDEIESTELQIDMTNLEIEDTQKELKKAQEEVDELYADMKDRIRYMYESGNVSMLEMLFTAEDMTDFLNKAEFIQNVSEYDRSMLDELRAAEEEIAEQERVLKEQQASLETFQEELTQRQDELNRKAEETSTDLAEYSAQLEALRAAQAQQQAAQIEQETQEAQSNSVSGNYDQSYPTGDGVLTKFKGVNYYNGFKETYYNLPMDGVYNRAWSRGLQGEKWTRGDGVKMFGPYVIIASDWRVIPYGSTTQCSLGTAISLDTGSFIYSNSYQIDIATNW